MNLTNVVSTVGTNRYRLRTHSVVAYCRGFALRDIRNTGGSAGLWNVYNGYVYNAIDALFDN